MSPSLFCYKSSSSFDAALPETKILLLLMPPPPPSSFRHGRHPAQIIRVLVAGRAEVAGGGCGCGFVVA
nr:hypothetical protein Itr_chr07CG16210 [Ipomoea trifida]